MNIYDISQKSGVSIATVSRVLNNSKNVSEKTRKKVLAVMEQESYQPQCLCQRPDVKHHANHRVFLCADSSDPYLGRAITFLEQGLQCA